MYQKKVAIVKGVCLCVCIVVNNCKLAIFTGSARLCNFTYREQVDSRLVRHSSLPVMMAKLICLLD